MSVPVYAHTYVTKYEDDGRPGKMVKHPLGGRVRVRGFDFYAAGSIILKGEDLRGLSKNQSVDWPHYISLASSKELKIDPDELFSGWTRMKFNLCSAVPRVGHYKVPRTNFYAYSPNEAIPDELSSAQLADEATGDDVYTADDVEWALFGNRKALQRKVMSKMESAKTVVAALLMDDRPEFPVRWRDRRGRARKYAKPDSASTDVERPVTVLQRAADRFAKTEIGSLLRHF